jgi:hypothetical protein
VTDVRLDRIVKIAVKPTPVVKIVVKHGWWRIVPGAHADLHDRHAAGFDGGDVTR